MKYLFFAIATLLAVATGSSFLGTEHIGLDARDAYIYPAVTDTLTNTEKDTITLPAKFKTNYILMASCPTTKLSGTQTVKMYLDEINTLTGTTGWRVIDSVTTADGTTVAIRQSNLYGLRYRLRMSSTATGVVRYTVNVTAKPI